MFEMMVAAALSQQPIPTGEPVEPLTVRFETEDAERFAALWMQHGGQLDAATLQRDYIDEGGRGIEIFTNGRIENGEKMARVIGENPGLYADAIQRCLPWALEATPRLRSTYLGLKGLLPDAELPRAALVVGSDNSGGTAQADMQVLGLEVLCRMSKDRDTFDRTLLSVFAHETVHSLQSDNANEPNELLRAVLREGVADYIASLIVGASIDPQRDAWAAPRRETIFNHFAADLEDWDAWVEAGMPDEGEVQQAALRNLFRWVGNAGHPPDDWPDELGYWVGSEIARRYVDNSDNPREAIRELLEFEDGDAIIAKADMSERLGRD